MSEPAAIPPRPWRVLFVDHTPFVGGAELALAHHVRAIDRTRFHPMVACTDRVPSLLALYRDAGAEVHVVAMPRLRRLDPIMPFRVAAAAWGLRRLVRRVDADLVVSNTSRAAYLSTIALGGSGIPLVWWVRDFFFDRRVFRALRGGADRIVCVAEAVRGFYGGAGDAGFDVIRVGSALHDELDRLSPNAVRAERTRLGFGDDDIVIGYMGRLVADKGAGDVVAAAVELHARDPRVRLLMVGTGDGQAGNVEPELRALVQARDLSFVRFVGHQTAEALYYSLFDVFVLASRVAEAYPTSVVQSMMAGTPVVATATGGTPELVIDGTTGLLVPPSSPNALVHSVRRLLDDPELRARIVGTARERVLRENRESVSTSRAEIAYEQAILSRVRRPPRRRPAASSTPTPHPDAREGRTPG